MNKRIRIRRDTAANWAEYNPVLRQGELGYVLDDYIEQGGVRYYVTKIGDGQLAWNSLPRAAFCPVPSGGGGGSVEISDVNGLQTALNDKAPVSHTHSIANITDLQTALDGKAASAHGHAIGDVSGLQDELDSKADADWVAERLADKSNVGHEHEISDVSGLGSALNDKAEVFHSHVMSNISDLSFPIISNPANTVAAGTSRWIPVGGSNAPATSAGSFTNVVPRALTTVNMRCTLVFSGTTTAAGSVTLYRNGSSAGNATTLSIPIPIGSTQGVFEFTNAVAYDSSDTWVIQLNSPTGTAIQFNNVILNYR